MLFTRSGIVLRVKELALKQNKNDAVGLITVGFYGMIQVIL